VFALNFYVEQPPPAVPLTFLVGRASRPPRRVRSTHRRVIKPRSISGLEGWLQTEQRLTILALQVRNFRRMPDGFQVIKGSDEGPAQVGRLAKLVMGKIGIR